MDFWSQKQGCRLPFMTSGTSQETPKEHEWNKTYTDKHGQSSHHQKRNKENTDRQGNQKTAIYGTKLRQ